jgi:murein tripeptide amidase MpaA
MPRENVFYYKSPLHHDHSVLSFAFSFDREDERYSFALAQPYSLARYNEHVKYILNKNLAYVSVDTIATTIQQRPCQMLTITNPCNLERTISSEERPLPKVIVILGRVRASEGPSSFIIQGFIDFLTSDHEIALSLRQHLVFKIVPVVNPDGVYLGNTRGNLLGMDLNRCWTVKIRVLNLVKRL